MVRSQRSASILQLFCMSFEKTWTAATSNGALQSLGSKTPGSEALIMSRLFLNMCILNSGLSALHLKVFQ